MVPLKFKLNIMTNKNKTKDKAIGTRFSVALLWLWEQQQHFPYWCTRGCFSEV